MRWEWDKEFCRRKKHKKDKKRDEKALGSSVKDISSAKVLSEYPVLFIFMDLGQRVSTLTSRVVKR